MKAHEYFLQYTTYATESREASLTTPSTKEQFALAEELVRELKAIGFANAEVDDKCYVYASIPATPGYEKKPAIGWVAHVDTAEDFGQKPTKAQVIPHYDGKAVKLGTSGLVLTPEEFPELPSLAGKTLITTDGTTTLGSDDKAGIAAILAAMETIQKEGLPHGKLCVGFTPDEETGRGADYFDVKRFGADYAYTVDGGALGELEYENFNAGKAMLTVRGKAVHPGSAKGIMINAILVVNDFINAMPPKETPYYTEGYEGFFHVRVMEATDQGASVEILIRDHDAAKYDEKVALLRKIEKQLKEKYGETVLDVEITEQYRNMLEQIKPHMHLIEQAKGAMRDLGIEPVVQPIRGGTDGARFSFMGLPCPNLCTGGYGFHGPYEHNTFEDMDRVADLIVGIVSRYAK